MSTLASWAEQLAQALLQEPLPRRWAHSQGVAARARSLVPVLGADADLLEAAAWLHDIGYAPGLAFTGLHQLDGARYLRDAQHVDALLCRLVAHHSCAIIEAGERGLADVLGLEFEAAPYALSSVLTCCDMTTSPDGELVPVEQRLADMTAKTAAEADLRARDLDWTIVRLGGLTDAPATGRIRLAPPPLPRARSPCRRRYGHCCPARQTGYRNQTLELVGGDSRVAAAVHSIS